MTVKKMRIRIRRDGKTEIRVEGAEGDECLDFTRAIEQAVGEVEHREMLSEQADPLQVETREEITESEREEL
ncbi:MAG TPA: DUF2997 domain-containing protein [Planctomycetaceae bacterium]|nr:DUF2997 domain-containing protein [Planctomycetaceae bacterium]